MSMPDSVATKIFRYYEAYKPITGAYQIHAQEEIHI